MNGINYNAHCCVPRNAENQRLRTTLGTLYTCVHADTCAANRCTKSEVCDPNRAGRPAAGPSVWGRCSAVVYSRVASKRSGVSTSDLDVITAAYAVIIVAEVTGRSVVTYGRVCCTSEAVFARERRRKRVVTGADGLISFFTRGTKK